MQSLPPDHPDLPSPRVCALLQRTFQLWRDKPLWLNEDDVGHLFRDRHDLSDEQRRELASEPIPLRKSRAIRRMFEIITDANVARRAGTFAVDPDELILGTLPPFSVGQGKEFVRYLTEEEELRAMLSYLNELSPMGHIVPDHERVVSRGLEGLIDDCRKRSRTANERGKCFLSAVRIALEAVIFLAGRYAQEAERVAATLAQEDPRRESLQQAADRLRRVPAKPAETFVEAVQSIYLMHCALHWTVEIVPLGRLDQILQPLYERDIEQGRLTPTMAQETLDCFWIKLDERAILNRRHLENRFTACDGVLTGYFGPSNYDQGGLLNQWMQQITIGGVIASDEEHPTDACNDVTAMCLECARRLPLNSPTLDLRVHAGTPDDVLRLAAQALMSGGAHPVLLQDDKIIAGFREVAGDRLSLASARNYACDGCYETMPAGESEFSFGFISAPDLIEKALNRGASFAGAGPIHLRGLKDSWRTPPACQLTTWDQLWATLIAHLDLSCHRYIKNLLANYGTKSDVAPSPLLSALIGGCIESTRDLVDGGARRHIFSPLLVGVSTAADSLHALRSLVYEQRSVGLEELVSAVATNWGANLVSTNGRLAPALGTAVSPQRIAEIRSMCDDLPKFGYGNREVDELAWKLIDEFCDRLIAAWSSELHGEARRALERRYAHENHAFEILMIPGVGTFEQYVFSGSLVGASPDGRRAGDPIASDLSPAPVHRDRSPTPDNGSRHARTGALADSFRSYADNCMRRLGDGAPADYNLPENFPVEDLASILKAFARGEGGSVATFTVCDPETFAGAQRDPEAFNLVRVRMGGWSEFFVTLFPEHQEHHRRRPLFVS
ncbi:pyruvate formate lyase family protein [Lacipirellula parvula]|uniref:pyruvate formate lyase family protein n=1 Tax=Lacipirellula parvula TaxID=2650471 RepID=UPI001562D7A6|nr:pyruvate formate lyase family protein [Lacipirellula parvula]